MDPLAHAMAAGFDAREAMAWSSEPVIQDALVERAWDGTLPAVSGDFFDDAEFEYAAKNGGGLHRTFDHDVVLHTDGSAQITTTVTIANTLPPNYGYDHTLNIDSLSLITIYGPRGATLGAASILPTPNRRPWTAIRRRAGSKLPCQKRRQRSRLSGTCPISSRRRQVADSNINSTSCGSPPTTATSCTSM